jgi:hypothetical protein
MTLRAFGASPAIVEQVALGDGGRRSRIVVLHARPQRRPPLTSSPGSMDVVTHR